MIIPDRIVIHERKWKIVPKSAHATPSYFPPCHSALVDVSDKKHVAGRVCMWERKKRREQRKDAVREAEPRRVALGSSQAC